MDGAAARAAARTIIPLVILLFFISVCLSFLLSLVILKVAADYLVSGLPGLSDGAICVLRRNRRRRNSCLRHPNSLLKSGCRRNNCSKSGCCRNSCLKNGCLNSCCRKNFCCSLIRFSRNCFRLSCRTATGYWMVVSMRTARSFLKVLQKRVCDRWSRRSPSVRCCPKRRRK